MFTYVGQTDKLITTLRYNNNNNNKNVMKQNRFR